MVSTPTLDGTWHNLRTPSCLETTRREYHRGIPNSAMGQSGTRHFSGSFRGSLTCDTVRKPLRDVRLQEQIKSKND